MVGPGESTPGAPKDPEASIEVFVQRNGNGAPKVGIQLNIWSKSLGWRPQKTLLLDPNQLPDLRRQLAAVEAHLRQTDALADGDNEAGDTGKVLPFPHISQRDAGKK